MLFPRIPTSAHTLTLKSWEKAMQNTNLGLRRRLNHHTASDVSKLGKLILGNIKATGPISFATYMRLCLSHPTHGYYMNPSHSVFGTSGDFITSPEISQVFGELIGIWFISQWVNAGKPPLVRLVELGPGRGTLMDDLIRIVRKFIPSKGLTGVHLVETSRSMRALQQAKLLDESSPQPVDLQWYDSIRGIPSSPSIFTMLVAHEFFDALPIHVLQKTETGWHEILVAANEAPPHGERLSSESTQPEVDLVSGVMRFRRVLSPTPSAASTLLGHSSSRFRHLPTGSIIEVSPTSFRIAHQVGQLLSAMNQAGEEHSSRIGGCGLIIDYGGDNVFGDSFRAFQNHKIVDVFSQPGDCDLTANVDFSYIREAMMGLVTTYGPITQANFLERMGLKVRIDGLLHTAKSDDRRKAILAAANRLVDQTGMGKEYQVLGITSTRGNEPRDVWPFMNVE